MSVDMLDTKALESRVPHRRLQSIRSPTRCSAVHHLFQTAISQHVCP